MKIYISHSTGFDYKKNLYTPLKKFIPASRLILPHEKSHKPTFTKDIIAKKECSFILAEVSYPSTGQGIELGWASLVDTPIICIYKEKSKISSSLELITSRFIPYKKISDLEDELEQIMSLI